MILSEKHKFIFIKGMKVAGTSIEIALSTLCGPDDIITPVSQVDELQRLKRGGRCRNYSTSREAEAEYLRQLEAAPASGAGDIPQPPRRYFSHMPLTLVALTYGRDLSGYRIVCAERSPYGKVISWANMQLSYAQYRTGGGMQGDAGALQSAIDQGFANGDIRHVRNIDRYRFADGRMAAEVLRHESLTDDFAGFVESLGERVPDLPHVKKGLLSERFDPKAVMRPDQITRVNQLFAEEFSTFGYPVL